MGELALHCESTNYGKGTMLTFMSRPYNIVNWVFWGVLLLVVIWAACRSLLNKKGPGPLAAALVSLLSVMVVLVGLRLVYVAPFAVTQDIVAARQVLKGEPVPSTEIKPLVRQALASELRPATLESAWPWLAAIMPGLPKQEQQEHDDIVNIIDVQAHPPCATMFMVPFVYFLGVYDTSIALGVLSIVCLGAALVMLYRGLPLSLSPSQALLVCGVLLGWYPMFVGLRSGQLGMILSMLVVAGWYAIRQNRPVLGGIAVGAAAALKLFPALLLVYFLLRHRRAFWAGVATFIVLNAATLAVVGPQFYLDYMQTARFVVDTWESDRDNWSLLAGQHHLGDILGTQTLASRPAFMAVSLLVVTVISVVVLSRTPSDKLTDLHYSLFVVAMTLLSPTCWVHYFVMLLLPIAVLAAHVNKGHDLPSLAYLVLFLVLSLPNFYYKAAASFLDPYLGPRAGLILVLLPTLALLGLLFWLGALAWTWSTDRKPRKVFVTEACEAV
jgi:hypothetical protein